MTQQEKSGFYKWFLSIIGSVIVSSFLLGAQIASIKAEFTYELKDHRKDIDANKVMLDVALKDLPTKAENEELKRVEAKIDNHLNEVAKW